MILYVLVNSNYILALYCYSCLLVVLFCVHYFSRLCMMQVLLLTKQRSRVIELKKSVEIEIQEIKQNSPGKF